eukprot:6446722-Ditylum_brightwellii.AAC.1
MKSWNYKPRVDELSYLGPIRDYKQDGIVKKAESIVKKEKMENPTCRLRYPPIEGSSTGM